MTKQFDLIRGFPGGGGGAIKGVGDVISKNPGNGIITRGDEGTVI